MKEHKTVENKFIWVPPDKRMSRFGGSVSPRKPETRAPVLWLAREGNELYLVNSSKSTLDLVIADGSGFQTVDDEVIKVNNTEKYEYTNVKPNNAVKIEEYDGFYDLDLILFVTIMIKSKDLGCINITPCGKKGGVKETVLLWDNGEKGKHVY